MKHTGILNACLCEKLNSALRDQLAPTNLALNRLNLHTKCVVHVGGIHFLIILHKALSSLPFLDKYYDFIIFQ